MKSTSIPAVPNAVLLILAGKVWDGVGLKLMLLAYSWLSTASRIQKDNLAIVYLGMGLALVLSGVKYLEIFFREIKGQ